MSDVTITNLTEVEDQAAGFGIGDRQEARFATGAVDAEHTGLALMRVKPGRRQAFGHRHDDAEEVYVVISGSGRIKLGDEVREVRELDAIRIAPGVPRALEGGPEGLTYVAFGPRHEGDGELLKDFWPEEG